MARCSASENESATPRLDQLLVNLYLMGALPDDRDLSSLDALCTLISRACQVPIPYNHPVFGTDAFRTATGVHAAAIIKAERKGDAFWPTGSIRAFLPRCLVVGKRSKSGRCQANRMWPTGYSATGSRRRKTR